MVHRKAFVPSGPSLDERPAALEQLGQVSTMVLQTGLNRAERAACLEKVGGRRSVEREEFVPAADWADWIPRPRVSYRS